LSQEKKKSPAPPPKKKKKKKKKKKEEEEEIKKKKGERWIEEGKGRGQCLKIRFIVVPGDHFIAFFL
jgi:hypothetical protein